MVQILNFKIHSCKYITQSLQEMRLSGSYQNCSEDFLQFGRDVLFITTHLRLELRKFYLCLHLNCVTSPLFAMFLFPILYLVTKFAGQSNQPRPRSQHTSCRMGTVLCQAGEHKFSTEQFWDSSDKKTDKMQIR